MRDVIICLGTYRYRVSVKARLYSEILQEIEDRFSISRFSITNIIM